MAYLGRGLTSVLVSELKLILPSYTAEVDFLERDYGKKLV